MEFFDNFLFEGIEESQCCEMMKCFGAREAEFQKGEIVYDFSRNSNSVGIVKSGSVQVIRDDINGNRVILERVEEKNLFGDALVFSLSIDSILVVAEERCQILFIDYSQITKRCSKACLHHTRLVENMFRLISGKVLALSERVEVLSAKTIRDKLLCYFNILSAREKKRTFDIPFSLKTLSEYLCVDRSAMMRELGNMKREGIIKMNRRSVEMLNFVV